MIIQKVKRETIEEPDLVIETNDIHKDTLKIYKRKNEIVIGCEVDGTGNFWHIPLNEIKELVK